MHQCMVQKDVGSCGGGVLCSYPQSRHLDGYRIASPAVDVSTGELCRQLYYLSSTGGMGGVGTSCPIRAHARDRERRTSYRCFRAELSCEMRQGHGLHVPSCTSGRGTSSQHSSSARCWPSRALHMSARFRSSCFRRLKRCRISTRIENISRRKRLLLLTMDLQ